MNRSGYDDCSGDDWGYWSYRGRVERTLRGRRSQAFLRELRDALDAMPVKELASHVMREADGCSCALDAVAVARGIEWPPHIMANAEYGDDVSHSVGAQLGITRTLAAEIMGENDCYSLLFGATERELRARRWAYMRNWVDRQIVPETD